ncbi:MAG: M20/M25/M40 family metallo-hydrolase [Actinobacteria bacterium]|nr:M20/M25/M40 family metallo-hydrolase [Actinomycetota bacterium]
MDDTLERELSEFIAIPSVSAEPAHREDVKQAGEWVCDFIRTKCGGTATLTPFGEKELALGEIPASSDAESAPTVLVYNHFDVQPPAPLDLWESDPFELTIRDEWAYARGVTDDKGQLYIMLKAAQKLVEANALPVNLRFACDGEEEIGGHTIVDWLAIDDVGADAGVIFDGGMLRTDVPAFDLATRGLIAFDVTVRTGARDLHSGMYGGAALNAIHVLMRCFQAVLAGPDGRLPEPLRAGITPPTQAELDQWATLQPGAEELAGQGARPLDAKAADEFYVRTWAEPSADVNGILGGKPGVRNTTLSVFASGEFTIRLAPGQRVDVIGPAAEKLVRAAAPEGADLDIKWAGADPGLVRADSPVIQLGVQAFEDVLGVKPLLVRTGGTLPIMPALEQKGIPTIVTGFGLPESNVHSPNERFLVRYFEQGIDTAAQLFTRLGELRTDGRS